MSSVAEESTENLARWSDRWQANRIGWHIDDINMAIVAHGDELVAHANEATSVKKFTRVLVPLCGKTHDMTYFSQHQGVTEVVGVDGIKKALQEFADEHPNLGVKEHGPAGSYETFQGNKIKLLKGDFFELTEKDTGGKCKAVFDRGALVAIEPNMRDAYLHVMKRVVAPGGKILLVTVEHNEGKGPPFSIKEEDVRRLYETQEWVESVCKLNPENKQTDELGRLDRWYMIQAKL
eukprot:scaffold3591_cov159-Amphora_coffeaeformis.AAC.13